VLVGLTLATSKGDIARAVVEGITLEMRDIVEAERSAGVEFARIRAAGGPTKSRIWNQMQADMYKVPVEVLKASDTGALGAALYAGVGAGVYGGYREAVDAAVHISEVYEPNPKVFAAYDDAYERFLRVYCALHAGKAF
jgi:xylulokinase